MSYSFRFESLYSLDVCACVVSNGLEILQKLLSLIDNSPVLQDRAVVRKIDSCGLRRVLGLETHSVSMALAEGLQSSNGLCIGVILDFWQVYNVGSGREPFPKPKEVYMRAKS